MAGERASNEILVLRVPRRKQLKLILFGSVFVALGVVLLAAGESPRAIAWLTVVCFGLGVAVGMVQLVAPGRLVVTDDAFEVTHLGRRWSRDLARCERFEVWRNPFARQFLVVFNHPDDDERRGSGASRALSGHSGALPDTYGMEASELARILNTARSRVHPKDAEDQPRRSAFRRRLDRRGRSRHRRVTGTRRLGMLGVV